MKTTMRDYFSKNWPLSLAKRKKCNHSNRKGFTLAEILIVIGIIGVVAAMIIPILMQNYQEQQTVTKYKKIYSEINSAIKTSEAEYGSLESWRGSYSTTKDNTQEFADNYLYPNLKTIKKMYVFRSRMLERAYIVGKQVWLFGVIRQQTISYRCKWLQYAVLGRWYYGNSPNLGRHRWA